MMRAMPQEIVDKANTDVVNLRAAESGVRRM
jgi:hypothetical protein